MPKNKGKGGKSRKKGKSTAFATKELIKKGPGQEYGQVVKLLGSSRLEVSCFDGVQRLGHIKGKIRKRVWIAKDDIVLIELRDYQDTKCDIIGKYTLQEAQTLKRLGEISSKINIKDAGSDDENDEFNDDDGDSGDEFNTDEVFVRAENYIDDIETSSSDSDF